MRWQPLTGFAKSSILDVGRGPESASGNMNKAMNVTV